MKRWIYGLLILGAMTMMSNTAEEDPEMLLWSADYKLSWDDFKGIPNSKYNNVSAMTMSGIVHYTGCKNGKISYKVDAYFEKPTSWVKPEAYNDYILAHEQLHFDITELYARKLRKVLSKKTFDCGDEVYFERFIANYLNKWQAKQINYDLFTNYSMRPEEQKRWQRKIEFELSLYEDYKSE